MMSLAEELKWMQDHPEFEERPATIDEFLGEDYLNLRDGVRPAVLKELKAMFGEKVDGVKIARVQRAIFTGAIGIGKTTVASIVLPYMAHWCLCLKSPQEYFQLLPGSRIAFMMMSTSESQAKEVLFGDIDARIAYSKWFREKYPKDPTFKNQIRFPKDIWILPGDSSETTFEGYNILGGIIDEADSHKVTKDKDYADVGYDTILSRVESRFQNRGFVMVVGQMKKANGFAARKYNEFRKDPETAHAARLTIWESFGWEKFLKPDGTRDSFWYDTVRKSIVPPGLVEFTENSQMIEIPNVYYKPFDDNPEKALRDLAGIPPATGDPFISLVHRITEARDRWLENYNDMGSPVKDNPTRVIFNDWFRATDSLKRAVHVDLAYSAEGDACGLAMGHVFKMVEQEGEMKPYIVIDMLARIHAAPGTEIMIQDVRHLIYYLRDELKFKVKTVTMDGFQSTDMMQQLRKKRFNVDYLSIDKNMLPYFDLREAIYEQRIEFPPYMTYIAKGDVDRVEIAVKELMELEDDGKKVDHPEKGSKDVADAMAGVVSTLMGDRQFRRGRRDLTSSGGSGFEVSSQPDPGGLGADVGLRHPAMGNMHGLTAPPPPSSLSPF